MKKIVLMFVIGIGLISCEEQPKQEETVEVQTIDLDVPVQTQVVTQTVEVYRKPKKLWNAKELKLPVGRIVKMDCSNCLQSDRNLKNNYITIECEDGYLRIFRDIDVDLYLNMEVNDSIN